MFLAACLAMAFCTGFIVFALADINRTLKRIAAAFEIEPIQKRKPDANYGSKPADKPAGL